MKLNIVGKKRLSLEAMEGRIGAMFMLPWLIGFIVFFAIPMVTSLIYSFNKVLGKGFRKTFARESRRTGYLF